MHAVITRMCWAIIAMPALTASPNVKADCDLRFAPAQIQSAARAHLIRRATPAFEPAPMEPPRTSAPAEAAPVLPLPPEPQQVPDSP